ncbi:MAG: helix-turn-helix domain-containing protein [Nitrospinae bacterium]|nr:helix-turn-helix domain-containing protein [Nitrospinota bacterium]
MAQLLTTQEAADFLCMSRQFLERDRWAGATIPFVRVGARTIRYRREDLDRYLASRVEEAKS